MNIKVTDCPTEIKPAQGRQGIPKQKPPLTVKLLGLPQAPGQKGSEVCFGAGFCFWGFFKVLPDQVSLTSLHGESNLSNLRAQTSILGGDVQGSACT